MTDDQEGRLLAEKKTRLRKQLRTARAMAYADRPTYFSPDIRSW